MASIDYYNDPSQYGNYQYITLEDIVNAFIMSGDDDDYTSKVPRYKVLYQARRAFRELYFDVTMEIKAIELELSPTLNVVLPPDFVNYVRISWVDEQGQLHPMAVDNTMSIAAEYLQDDQYELLFDDNGCVLIGTDDTPPTAPVEGEVSGNSCISRYTFCTGFNPNKNHSKQFPNGRYRIDKNNGIIQFGSEVFGKHIVLEYISDGLFTGCEGLPEEELRIHKFAEMAVLDFIYWKLTQRRRNVPAIEKQRAEKSWWNSRRLAKRRLSTLRLDELLQVFKGSNKWIKGV